MAKLEAVVEIGSTGVRLLIAEIASADNWTIIDRSELPIAMGRDVFTSGTVSRETLMQCLHILKRFREQLAGWGINQNDATVIGTSAMREARNRDMIIDRINVKTGFKVHVIDGIEENRLMYIAVIQALQKEEPKLKKFNSIIMEVGGGSTEIMLLKRGKMAAVHSIRLGTVIIEQHVKAMMGSEKDTRRLLEEYIKNTGGSLNEELKLDRVHQFIAIGSEAHLVARTIGKKISEHCWKMPRSAFDSFVEKIQTYSIEECIAQFKIPYSDAEAMSIGLLAYKLFISLTNTEEVIVPDTSIREGVIISKISEPNHLLREEFYSQVVASALNLGKKYHIDEAHGSYVRTVALQLFDQLRYELGLDRYSRLLLEIAALLHDVGMFIRTSDHNLHSQYIIGHSDVFGLNKDDMVIISNVARYHRGEMPTISDSNFYGLPRADRTLVLKLASILRIADALDRRHSQSENDFEIDLRGETRLLRTQGTHHMTLEKLALAEKANLFEDIFGYKIILV